MTRVMALLALVLDPPLVGVDVIAVRCHGKVEKERIKQNRGRPYILAKAWLGHVVGQV